MSAPQGGPWTRHGHDIPGTTVAGGRPPAVARCGGPALCRQCREDVAVAQGEKSAAPDRPTRAQVDAALTHVVHGYTGPRAARVLAAEVRALRAELEALDDAAAAAVTVSGRRWAAHATILRPEREEAREALGLEMGMRTAAVDELETLRRRLWALLDADQLSDDDTVDRLRAALAASTPQPAEPVIYRCDQSNHPSVPCSRCEVVTPAPLPAVPDGEARDRLLRHYLGKAAARLDLPDQARRVTPTADVDEIESVGEAVLAELERLRGGPSQPDARDVVPRLYAAAAALSDAEPMSCAGGDLFGIAVALGYMPVEVRAAVAAALSRPTERD